jgi:hypothetical protein
MHGRALSTGVILMVLGLTALPTAAAGALPSAPAAPTPRVPTGTQQQVEADQPIAVPKASSCTVAVMTSHAFANSYGAPFIGTYNPPAACPGAVVQGRVHVDQHRVRHAVRP